MFRVPAVAMVATGPRSCNPSNHIETQSIFQFTRKMNNSAGIIAPRHADFSWLFFVFVRLSPLHLHKSRFDYYASCLVNANTRLSLSLSLFLMETAKSGKGGEERVRAVITLTDCFYPKRKQQSLKREMPLYSRSVAFARLIPDPPVAPHAHSNAPHFLASVQKVVL